MKFTHDHNLEVGYLVNFLYKGDSKMSVRVFDDKSCRMHYHDNNSGNYIRDEGEGH
jgi:hypothetical protein